MSDTEELHRVQHKVLEGMAKVTFGLREIAESLRCGHMSMHEAASELRFLADALTHKLRVMSE